MDTTDADTSDFDPLLPVRNDSRIQNTWRVAVSDNVVTRDETYNHSVSDNLLQIASAANGSLNGSINGDLEDVESGVQAFHCHDSARVETDKVAKRQLIAVLIMCVLFIAGEATGALLSNSLALLTDVLHMLSDLVSFAISLLSFFLATKKNTIRMSFGYYRAEVIGALFSVFLIWLVTGVLCYMAVESITGGHYINVKPSEMLITASISVVFNIIMGAILHSEFCCRGNKLLHTHSHGHSHSQSHSQSHGHSHSHSSSTPYQQVTSTSDSDDEGPTNHARHKNINVRAAFIHVIGDFIQSIGVLIAAFIIKFTTEDRFKLADPIMTFVFSILVLFTTFTVLRDTLIIMMEGVPRDIDYTNIYRELKSINHVRMVHSLNVWALTMGKNALSVHLAVDTADHQSVLEAATTLMRSKYHFLRLTIQVEKFVERNTLSCHDCHSPWIVDS